MKIIDVIAADLSPIADGVRHGPGLKMANSALVFMNLRRGQNMIVGILPKIKCQMSQNNSNDIRHRRILAQQYSGVCNRYSR